MLANPDVEKSNKFEVVFWICSSICCSVGLILLNKVLMNNYEFKFVLTLTTAHFLCQMMLMEGMSFTGVFVAKRMPLFETLFCASCMAGSVVFMNFSLQYNTVGFYQIAKLACIPVTVVIESFMGKVFSRRIKITLGVIILGIGCAVVTDVGLNTIGFIFGVIAIFTTVAYQIWAGNYQRQLGINGKQYTHSVSPYLVVMVGVSALVVEVFPMKTEQPSVLKHAFSATEVGLIGLSCMLAIGVNISTASLIRVTSAITYQVVGHAKTILLLIGGFLFFPIPATSEQIMKNVVGVTIAMVGVILYGDLKGSKGPDVCQRYCAGTCVVADEPVTPAAP